MTCTFTHKNSNELRQQKIQKSRVNLITWNITNYWRTWRLKIHVKFEQNIWRQLPIDQIFDWRQCAFCVTFCTLILQSSDYYDSFLFCRFKSKMWRMFSHVKGRMLLTIFLVMIRGNIFSALNNYTEDRVPPWQNSDKLDVINIKIQQEMNQKVSIIGSGFNHIVVVSWFVYSRNGVKLDYQLMYNFL